MSQRAPGRTGTTSAAPTTVNHMGKGREQHQPSPRGGLGPPQNGPARREQAASRRCPPGPHRGAVGQENHSQDEDRKVTGAQQHSSAAGGNTGQEVGLQTASSRLSSSQFCGAPSPCPALSSFPALTWRVSNTWGADQRAPSAAPWCWGTCQTASSPQQRCPMP